MKKLLTAIALVGLSGTLASTMTTGAMAQDSDGPNWKYIEGSIGVQDIDGLDFDLSGGTVEGSMNLGKNMLLQVSTSFTRGSEDLLDLTVDRNDVSAMIGARFGLSSTADFYVLGGYNRINLDATNGNITDTVSADGWKVKSGVRMMLSSNLEADIHASYADLGDMGDQDSYGAGLTYFTSSNWGFGAKINLEEDNKTYMATVRFRF